MIIIQLLFISLFLFYFYFIGTEFDHVCIDHMCKGGMQIEEGKQCIGNLGVLGTRSTLQCKEGLVCVRNNTLDSTYVCKKAHTQRGQLSHCESDSDCAYDATCECDDSIGKNVCVPMPASSKGLWEKARRYYEGGSADDAIGFYEYLIGGSLYYDANYRCGAYMKEYKSEASSVKNALVALFAFLLSF